MGSKNKKNLDNKIIKCSYVRENYLTDEILKNLGFTEAVDFVNQKCWRISIPYYAHMIQISIRPHLPRTNPNCGVLSIYSPAETLLVVEDNGKERKKKLEESTHPIAWYVDTCERLKLIIDSLTHRNLY